MVLLYMVLLYMVLLYMVLLYMVLLYMALLSMMFLCMMFSRKILFRTELLNCCTVSLAAYTVRKLFSNFLCIISHAGLITINL